MDNHLSASALIVLRLQREIPTVPAINIRPAVSLDWVVKSALSPAINVIFFDDVPDTGVGGQAQRGKTQASQQFWLIVVTTKNVADAGNAARQDAGILLQAVLMALQGWMPSPQHGELHRQKSPYRATDIGGFVHLPLLFSTKIITIGSAV